MTAPLAVLLNIALRTSVIYLALFVGLRLTGARQLGQMSTFDLVLLLVISNAVQNAMLGPDTSLVGGLVAAGVLISWHTIVERARLLNPRLHRLFAGEGVMLINRGVVLTEHCKRAGVNRDDLLQALREHGVASVQDVRLAVLEPDGAISVLRNDDVISGTRPHHRIRSLKRGQ